MKGRLARAAVVCAAVLVLGAAPGAGADPGNSAAAHACQQGGYLSLVGSDGTTFRNVGACVSHVARGGTFATGIIIPAGKIATLANATWALPPCDSLTYGYQLNLGALVPLASKPAGCFGGPAFPLAGAVIGPFPTATLLRIYLTDTGFGAGTVCNYTYFSDGVHALVTGTNPYTVDIRDSFFCQLDPTEPYVPYAPAAPGAGNIGLTVTIT